MPTKSRSQLLATSNERVPGTFGYINEDDPFEDDQQLEASPWWELSLQPDRILTHAMTSEALWHALMTSARQLRYNYIRGVPHITDPQRQRQAAMVCVMKLQLLNRLALNLVSSNVLMPSAEDYTWLSRTIEGMQVSFQKRYGTHRIYD